MPLDPVAYRPYQDPDDFIREVTDRIWVQRDISYITDNYEPDSIVHGGLGTIAGRDGVIEGSLMRIAQVPQHVGQAEDVIWETRGDDAFLSSHLVFSSDTHLVGGVPVPIRQRTIANCLYRRGRMVEEWVVRDELASCLQRGLDPAEAARDMAFRGYEGSMTAPAPADVLAVGDSGPRADDFRPECEMVLEFIEEVWNARRLHKVTDYMPRDLFLHTVGDRTVIRPDGYQRDLLAQVAPFPDARFEVRDVQTNQAGRYGGLRIAVVWVMKGSYRGVADFGPLTGRPVDLMGISQFLVQQGRIVREVRVFDQLALRAQINSHESSFTDTNIY
ncbi:nuclear transport factor 2 family protein [Amycolatopsis jiangsuensis]|uniref:Putative ester cyclase n=1 Tax=Amycolatopsis jiangsuensis TaxID=1181879 RepID=A0A840IPX6_9PSEU|nr:ester cyclase [Amycolatopsis jiangsuensis]MBB4683427.1 putative ester cyclase [Amycolatopsis jiangsuensis]